jgi:arylsulfatase A-like enzyme
VIDRLHAGMVGAYGNAWIHTGQFDALAAESFLFDQAYSDAPQIGPAYRGFWRGTPAVGSDKAPGESLIAVARRLGLAAVLVTDEPAVAELPEAADFDHTELLPTAPSAETATDLADTQLGQFFAAAAQAVGALDVPSLVWLHTRGLGLAWDAPLPFRDQFAEDDEPLPPRAVEVPDRALAADTDPDEVWGLVQAYAGQVALLDALLGGWIEALDENRALQGALCAVLSLRGFPLGEHRHLGPRGEALHNELAQLAWLLRFPQRELGGQRSQALVRPADLYGTLLDWWQQPPGDRPWPSLLELARGERSELRAALALASGEQRAVRTDAWLLRAARGAPPGELFAKPSDRWEVNELARRCPEIAAELWALLERLEQGAAASAAELPAELRTIQD